MTNDDRRTTIDRAAGGAFPPHAATMPLGGGIPTPTGTPTVDILREPVDLGQQDVHALHLWVISNELPNTHGWPVRINWPASTITYWPDGVDRGAAEGSFTKPLKHAPLPPLWRILADRGALWCADPTHYSPTGTVCPHRVDSRGKHPTPPPEPPSPDELLEQFVRLALERAAQGCEHPDPGQPIYGSSRGCAQCAATAVMDLFRTADAIEAFRARHTPPTVGYWEAGKGHRYPRHPGGFRPV